MRFNSWILPIPVLLFGIFITLQLYTKPSKKPVNVLLIQNYIQDVELLAQEVENLEQAVQNNASVATIQNTFKQARLVYKRTEFLVEVYKKATAKLINGPVLPEVEPYDAEKLIEPEGFQVIEEFIFPVYDQRQKEELLSEIRNLSITVKRLAFGAENLAMNDTYLWDAIRNELFRVISLGITGFDSPVALHSLPEAAGVLEKLSQTCALFKERIEEKDPKIYQKLQKRFATAIQYLQGSADFDAFDRLEFITTCINPLTTALWDAQTALQIPFVQWTRPLRTDLKTLFEKNAFRPHYYALDRKIKPSQPLIDLGEMLFFDPVLSGNNQRTCASCHQPGKAFSDGLSKSVAFDFKGEVARNSPTLINAALQASLFHDGRSSLLEHQIQEVIHNPVEMGGALKESTKKIVQSNEYQQLFSRAFPATEKPVNEKNIRVALANYIRSLVNLDSRVDLYLRGEKNLLNASEKRGFNLFTGKAKCATCHFIPLFNGTVPPSFQQTEVEVLGVPAEADTANTTVDRDEGRHKIHGIKHHKFAFKTPTIRNIEYTAPYMHNGVYQTLEEVIDFYNRGGGKGIGIDLPNQTLPEDALNLTQQEQHDLIAFMKALSSLSKQRQRPARLPAIPGIEKRKPGGDY